MNKKHCDLSKVKTSLTFAVESLISEMESLSYTEIKSEFISILENSDFSISSQTKMKWKNALEQKTSKTSLMFMITSLYLSGCNLSAKIK